VNEDGHGVHDEPLSGKHPDVNKIRVAIVEDEPATRAALVQRLSATLKFELLFEADSLRSARASLRALTPDVLIVDLGLPDGSGLDLIAELSERCPALAILVLTVFGDEQKLIRAFERGARGYLLKDETSIGLVDAIEQILTGGRADQPGHCALSGQQTGAGSARQPTASREPADGARSGSPAPGCQGLQPRRGRQAAGPQRQYGGFLYPQDLREA
jgi:DNA-binding NarL/FixJ family response regulator